MLERFILNITTLRREREIIVLLPDDYYQSNKSYPVLYINDGQNAFIDQEAFIKKSWGFAQYSKKQHLDVIMVGIYCNFEGDKRIDEYGPWLISEELSFYHSGKKGKRIGGEGDKYIQWLGNECKQFIDQKYRTIQHDTAICGSSMGGVISAYACLKYPEIFPKCAALSTAFWFNMSEFEELIKRSDPKKIECFYFDVGNDEGNGDDTVSRMYLQANNYIYHLLKEKGFVIHYSIYQDAKHNEWEWEKRVPVFMNLFYGK